MIIINIKNVEDLVFKQFELRQSLSDLSHLFDQWHLSCRLPELRSMGNKAKLDFINSVNDNHVKILEEYFKDTVVLDRLDYNIVKNISFSVDLERLGGLLLNLENFANFVVSRNQNEVNLSFWR